MTCKRTFHPLGIMMHRQMYKNKKELCKITLPMEILTVMTIETMSDNLSIGIRRNSRGKLDFAEGDLFSAEHWYNVDKKTVMERIDELIDDLMKVNLSAIETSKGVSLLGNCCVNSMALNKDSNAGLVGNESTKKQGLPPATTAQKYCIKCKKFPCAIETSNMQEECIFFEEKQEPIKCEWKEKCPENCMLCDEPECIETVKKTEKDSCKSCAKQDKCEVKHILDSDEGCNYVEKGKGEKKDWSKENNNFSIKYTLTGYHNIYWENNKLFVKNFKKVMEKIIFIEDVERGTHKLIEKQWSEDKNDFYILKREICKK